jgi:hypothetical protein
LPVGFLRALAGAPTAGRAFGVARFLAAVAAAFCRLTLVVAVARGALFGAVELERCAVDFFAAVLVREERAARAPREVDRLVEPPATARPRAGLFGRGVLRLAMTRPFRGNLDSLAISNVSSTAYRD